MLLIIKIIVLLAYLSLLLELTVFHVPSVASSVNIFKPSPDLLSNYSVRFQDVFHLANWKKILVFLCPLVVIYLAYLFPIVLYFDLGNWSLGFLFEPHNSIKILGLILIIFGRVFTFSSMVALRKDNAQKGDSFHLHTGNIFKLTRNPGLVGLYIFMLGLWLILPSIYFLVGILIYFGHMHFKVLMEEDFLKHKYGESYENYFKNSKRYLI